MLDIGVASNVMPLNIMERLGLKMTLPYKNYKNVCVFDFMIVPTHGLIQGKKDSLHAHTGISFFLYIMVVDIPITYAVLLSRK